MTTYRFMPSSRNTGFSLIEVLVAVLVLSTGMLALAALQASLTRNSVDAKVRSQGLAIAVDVLDRVRARASSSNGDYQSLPVAQGAWQTWSAPATFGTLQSPASYETRSTVTRFVRDATAAGCGGAANAPCFRPAVAADPYQLSGTAEFKRVNVEVRWTDAAGTAKTVSVNDVVTSVTRDKSTTVMTTQPTPASGVGAPVARIPRPTDAGIIPIAVGTGRETAASNPKPVLGYERGRSDETSFQVYTYGTSESGVAQLSRLIDTKVVGCQCERGALPSSVPNNASYADVIMNPFFRIPKQPTYWNGKEYVVPEDGASIARGVPIESAIQNQELCVTCCLDHHDSTVQPVKFDAARSGGVNPAEPSHLHYGDDNDDGILNTVAARADGDDYFEVCRFIRVDGVFRVATDARLKFMNLLETDPTVTTESVPAATPRLRYQSLVKDLISQYVVGNVSTPNVSAYDDILVQPDEIRLGRRLDKRFLHGRGLYIDVIEADAQQAIQAALDDCPDATPDIDCVLPVVPFVSINTTGLAQWGSTSQANVRVYNLARSVSQDPRDPPLPRGLTEALTDGTRETASMQMQLSNSGLSDSYGIDPVDVSETSIDEQVVRVGTTGSGGTTGSVTISRFTGLDDATVKAMSIGIGEEMSSTNVDCQRPTANNVVYPVTCNVAYALPARSKLVIGNYNKLGRNYSDGTCGTQKVQYCQNFNVTGVTVNNASVLPLSSTETGTLQSEKAVINLGSIPNSADIQVTLAEGAAVPAPHTCVTDSRGKKSVVYSNTALPCQGVAP